MHNVTDTAMKKAGNKDAKVTHKHRLMTIIGLSVMTIIGLSSLLGKCIGYAC